MADSRSGNDDRGDLERLGSATGAMAGKAADFGLEMTGALFRSAADMLGGWWSSDGPLQAAELFGEAVEQDCRRHYSRTASDTGRARDGIGAEAPAHDRASDGFERARAGYQLGWVAKQNPAYRDRSFAEVEPELREVWETRTPGADEGDGSIGLWPQVRGYVDYGYGEGGGDETRR